MKKLLILLFLLFTTNVWADSQLFEITEMDATPAGADLLYITDSGSSDVSRRITYTNLTAGNFATATALAANGADCSAGSYPLGVDASGASTDCTDASDEYDTEAELETFWSSANIILATEIDGTGELLAITDYETGTGALVFGTSPTLVTPTLGAATATTLDTGSGANELYDLPLASGADADSTEQDTDSGLEIVSGGVTLLRGCDDNDILKWDETADDWNCEADAGEAGGGDSVSIDGSAVTDPDFVSTADIDFIDTSNTVTANINAAAVEESHLNEVNGPTDEYCLTYESDTTNFAWQSCSAGAGDVTGVGDCADGACYDGTSDGGTYARIYDGDSHYVELNPGNVTANRTITYPDSNQTVGTATTISGSIVDMSDNANLTAGDYITLTDDDLDIDAEVITDVKCIWFEDPTAADDFSSIWRNSSAKAYTFTEIWAESDQYFAFGLEVDDGTPASVETVALVANAGEVEDTSLGGDTELAADEELNLNVVKVSGTPTWASICWTYTKSD